MKREKFVVIQGWFYESDRYHKTIQLRMVSRMNWLMNYGFDCNLLYEGSKTACSKFIKSYKS